jgi:transketolase
MSETVDIATAYAQALVEAGGLFPNLIVLDADLPDSCITEPFNRAYPQRTFDLGIAEQSLPTFAAGLALMGKIPFYNTFAVFAVTRGLDMVRQSIAYNHANVKIVGHAAGQSLGYAGPSHHSLEDISAMRAIPNLVILSPCDAEQTRQMVLWMADYNGPVYLRLPRSKVPAQHDPDYRFEVSKCELIFDGKDISIFTTGDLIGTARELRQKLLAEHIEAQVVNVPTLKPLPAEEILLYGRQTRAGLTIEDHNVFGGLGSAVAEIYAEFLEQPLKRIGIPDTFTESDDREVLLEAYGVSAGQALQAAHQLLKYETPNGGNHA